MRIRSTPFILFLTPDDIWILNRFHWGSNNKINHCESVQHMTCTGSQLLFETFKKRHLRLTRTDFNLVQKKKKRNLGQVRNLLGPVWSRLKQQRKKRTCWLPIELLQISNLTCLMCVRTLSTDSISAERYPRFYQTRIMRQFKRRLWILFCLFLCGFWITNTDYEAGRSLSCRRRETHVQVCLLLAVSRHHETIEIFLRLVFVGVSGPLDHIPISLKN